MLTQALFDALMIGRVARLYDGVVLRIVELRSDGTVRGIECSSNRWRMHSGPTECKLREIKDIWSLPYHLGDPDDARLVWEAA